MPADSTEIALIRHFPTDWNREQRLQGRADRPLTADARARLAELRLPRPWDRAAIVASTLCRARETAESLAEGRPVQLDARLVEQDWGDWEGLIGEALLADPASGFVATHLMGPDFRPPNGETARDVLARVRPALAGIGGSGRRTLLVVHKAVMRHLMREAHGLPAEAEAPEIKRARLYPMRCDAQGRLSDPAAPMRLVPRREAARDGAAP
ncbi:hypothetical protein LNKW23_10460 [Paralimibaculum aggregatum]|uniref:Histidine phosphatase family protein n=1 Tax=Paralimibaculum aggregatum TaxID=3036245 RepID=A0ABQ6LLY0_9RHOB|nr:histidine phosphatase family protein [Limibaculum sp. NKW23]GMG81833.1 hypothetical protein LNKW23_10460 [Limibaculum sp. NKW23]